MEFEKFRCNALMNVLKLEILKFQNVKPDLDNINNYLTKIKEYKQLKCSKCDSINSELINEFESLVTFHYNELNEEKIRRETIVQNKLLIRKREIDNYINGTNEILKIDKNSKEFQIIQKKMNIPNEIVQIEQNCNPMLLKKYLKQKQTGKFKEYFLYHGSSDENISNILEFGFDIKYSKDGLLGKGIYFAENPTYSVSYSQPFVYNESDSETNSLKSMIIARVLINDLTRSRNLTGNSIYCVDNNSNTYPDYIIYYK